MAIPVLITVGALGAGWILLSKERAKVGPAAPGASGAPGRDTGSGVVRDHGAEAPASTPGEYSVHTKGGLEVAAMGFAEGGATTDPGNGVDPTTGAGGLTGDALPRPGTASAGTPSDVPAGTASKYSFGAHNVGATSGYQEARALAEHGPALGQVW
jgi:hypothetical protein